MAVAMAERRECLWLAARMENVLAAQQLAAWRAWQARHRCSGQAMTYVSSAATLFSLHIAISASALRWHHVSNITPA